MGLAILILALFPVVYVFAPRAAFVALGVAIVLIVRGRTRRGSITPSLGRAGDSIRTMKRLPASLVLVIIALVLAAATLLAAPAATGVITKAARH